MSHLRPIDLADLSRGKLSAKKGGKKAENARRHLDECAGCQAAFARVRAANQAFVDLLEQPLPEVGVIRGEATVRWTRIPPQATVRRPFVIAAGFALAAAGFLLVWNPRSAPSSNGPLVVHLTAPRATTDRPLEAVVTLLGGVVNVTHDGSTERLDPSMSVKSGDRLTATAEARVAAQWAEGSGFLLLGDSQLAIERLASHEVGLTLASGKVDVRRGPHGPNDALIVTAPAHIIRARGTWFTVAASRYETTVEVLEGVVEVSDRDGGASTTILHAPTRAVFGRGKLTQGPLGAHDAAQLRAASEMNLLAPASRDDNAVMTISSEPAGTLAVDGVELGPTPLQARQPIGRHYIEISRKGFDPQHRWMMLGGAEPGQLRVALAQSRISSDAQSAPVEIESMIRARSPQIRACYERRLKRDPTLAGTVSLRLRVGDAGQVRQATVEESTLADPMVGECLRKEALGWSFKQGRNATVVYPFVFRAQ